MTDDSPPSTVEEADRDEEQGEGPTYLGPEKESLPSIKSTRKDVSKNANTISNLHKVQLLVEILTILEQYKAHSTNNTYQQWRCVQDALESKPIGKKYRRMDKPYCFKKKVMNAVDSWVTWAEQKGYPTPGMETTNDKMPPFVRLVYRVYSASSGNGKRGGSLVDEDEDQENSMGEEEDVKVNVKEEEPEEMEASSPQATSGQNRMQENETASTVTPSTETNSGRKRAREVNRPASRIDASNDLAEVSATIANFNHASQNSTCPHMRRYLDISTSYLKTKADISAQTLRAMKAEQEDEDIARLERLEVKISKAVPGSILHVQYVRQRDKCLDRLHGKS